MSLDIESFPKMGLSTDKVKHLREKYGFNEIEQEKSRSPFILFVEQFKSSLVLILVFASGLSGFLGEWVESIAIAAILLLNALIGFFQEYRAENAVLALKNMTAPRASVLRNGVQVLIPAVEVVPGDSLVLEAGDIVAADGIILQSARLQINEAILTGESFPVDKNATPRGVAVTNADGIQKVFMGTAVSTGTAIVEVTSIGMATELGKIAHLITTAEPSPTPLQVQMVQVGRMLLAICLMVVGIVLAIGLWQGRPWLELIIFSVSLAVAAVPEGMPAIITVALALGVQRMAARHALVRRLPSVETLGSVSVICTDKTGTLTTGNMRVRELWGHDHRELLRAAASCCDAELDATTFVGTGDSTEIAILIAAREQHFSKAEIEKDNARVAVEPFDSLRRRMSIFRQDGFLYVKGAFESVVPLCGQELAVLKTAEEANQRMGAQGLRILAVAIGEGRCEENLKFLGLIGIADPPRPEAMQAIASARSAGITPIMITGDHPLTALAIARELGLVVEGEATEGKVHARATPEAKLNLVRHWKSKGAVVAMTGDGVNDAPALKEAHIGIAMGKNGTEVTRQAADLILADDNFATIIAAVREGRGVYQNIRKAVVYLITGNLAELIVVLGASALGLPLPFLAAHLLWINLVTDSLPGLALIADPVTNDVMNRPPRDVKEALLGKPQWMHIAWVGLLEASVILFLFIVILKNGDLQKARNLIFTALVLSQLWRSFGARSQSKTFIKVGVFTNPWLLGVVFITAAIQLSLHFIPFTQKIFGLDVISLQDFFLILPVSLVAIFFMEVKKILKIGHCILNGS